MSGPVVVSIAPSFTATSNATFSYVVCICVNYCDTLIIATEKNILLTFVAGQVAVGEFFFGGVPHVKKLDKF